MFYAFRSIPRRLVKSSSDQNRHTSPVISRIMLRFRPIAPKPASAPGSLPDNHLAGRRTKRKYVRVRARRMKKFKGAETKKTSPPETSEVEDAPPPPAVTLQLLPERSDSDYIKKVEDKYKNNNIDGKAAMGDQADNNSNNNNKVKKHHVEARKSSSSSSSVIQTWIIAECVSMELDDERYMGLGFSMKSDRERMYDLERDTCPGFVSDGGNKVIWVNEAYKRMVGGAAQVSVRLVVKEAVQMVQVQEAVGWFACRARLWVEEEEEEGGRQKWKKWTVAVACDVWKMEFPWAGFAWKLDLHTALTLSSPSPTTIIFPL